MTDPITNRTAQLLDGATESFVRLDELYQQLANEGWVAWIDVEMFQSLLENDQRFEILDGLGEPLLQTTVANPAELGILDFLSGPWVLLCSRKLHTTQILNDLLNHLHQMNEILEATWQRLSATRPAGELTTDLLNMLMLGDVLERQIREALTHTIEEAESDLSSCWAPPKGDNNDKNRKLPQG